ncbi:YciI family protein [Pendulispora rubella]|uniref:YciI family protein n=1 Tax=Pendulispora rubella TaxID=2741070 RepID=A0ABZ2L1R9_9BACT
MHFILFYDVVEDYVTKRTPFRGQHLELARAAYDRGELVLAGALANPADGAVLVFRDGKAAEAFAVNDPYVKNGVVVRWRIREWTTVLGDGATLPTL